jgi:hypothetical protein
VKATERRWHNNTKQPGHDWPGCFIFTAAPDFAGRGRSTGDVMHPPHTRVFFSSQRLPSAAKVASCQPFPQAADILARGQVALSRIETAHWSDRRDIIVAHDELRTQAFNEAGTNKPFGSAYRKAIAWRLRLYGFDRIHKSDRCRLFECADNFAAIDIWRAGLPADEQLGLNHPRVVLAAYKRAQHPNTAIGKREALEDKQRALLNAISADRLLKLLPNKVRFDLEDRLIGQIGAAEYISGSLPKRLNKTLYRALREVDPTKRGQMLQFFIDQLTAHNLPLESVQLKIAKSKADRRSASFISSRDLRARRCRKVTHSRDEKTETGAINAGLAAIGRMKN